MGCRTSLASWQKLTSLAASVKQLHLKDLFNAQPQRFDQYSVSHSGILFDYSKNLVSSDVLKQLIALAEDCELSSWRDKMFSGEKINITEQRAVLHTALRGSESSELLVDGENVLPLVTEQLEKVATFVNAVRSGDWRGATGKVITDIVSIGVGGSNLGPQMVTEALSPNTQSPLNVHYVSNADGVQIATTLEKLNAETTLFVVSSKTFTTSETMTNANTAVNWLKSECLQRDAVSKHFVAVSTNIEKTTEFGIDPDNVFTMWDWVGGRFSLWSTIGLPIALYLGFDQFNQLLKGAHAADLHFKSAPFEQNIPVLMALLSLWNTTFMGAKAQAILPYDQSMHMLPAYLQQAEMESNGKSTTFAGEQVAYTSVPLIWGMTGINGQHAFYQYLHQGTTVVPADFIGSVTPRINVGKHHTVLMSNMFAQTEALMNGVTDEEVAAQLREKGADESEIESLVPHKVHQGNRPTTTILLDKIDAFHVGQLIALYEHKIFTQGILLDVCSFDQWGVELGKGLANAIQGELERGEFAIHDSSTTGLLNYFSKKRVEYSA